MGKSGNTDSSPHPPPSPRRGWSIGWCLSPENPSMTCWFTCQCILTFLYISHFCESPPVPEGRGHCVTSFVVATVKFRAELSAPDSLCAAHQSEAPGKVGHAKIHLAAGNDPQKRSKNQLTFHHFSIFCGGCQGCHIVYTLTYFDTVWCDDIYNTTITSGSGSTNWWLNVAGWR